MFGCIVAGRPVQTNLQVVSPTKFVFMLPQAESINHLVLFLTGERPFDEGFGASIYFNSDVGIAQGAQWQYLGILTNMKASAIFKVRGLHHGAMNIELGISIEPLPVLEQLAMQHSNALIPATTPAVNPSVPSPDQIILLSKGIGENLFNYILSFTRSAGEIAMSEPGMEVVPMRAVQEWFNTLVRKITADPLALLRQLTKSN